MKIFIFTLFFFLYLAPINSYSQNKDVDKNEKQKLELKKELKEQKQELKEKIKTEKKELKELKKEILKDDKEVKEQKKEEVQSNKNEDEKIMPKKTDKKGVEKNKSH